MTNIKRNTNSRIIKYAKSILDYLIINDLEYDKYDYDYFAEELDVAIKNGEIVYIPELDREDAFKLAISMKEQSDSYDNYEFIQENFDNILKSSTLKIKDFDLKENLIKETDQIIKMLNESLASKQAKKLGLYHIGFGNYAKEPGGKAIFKTVDGKLKKVNSLLPKKKSKKTITKKETLKKEKENLKKERYKKLGITDIRKISGNKPTYEFMKDGRKYKFTLNKSEREELKKGGSIINIIKKRLKNKEIKQKDKFFKKGKHLDKK